MPGGTTVGPEDTTVTIDTVELDGNEIDVNLIASVEVESNPWLLRSAALASRSADGYKSIEVETLSGKRILVQGKGGTYVDVPKNNDSVIFSMSKVYSCIVANITATAVGVTGLSSLAAAHKASMKYYAQRYLLRTQLNNESLSYTKKSTLLADYEAVEHSALIVIIPGVTGTNWEFVEANGLSISYWTNGPYADIKLSVISRKLITI